MIRPDQLFNAPIPGQSLTEDPAARKPWELPPKFSSAGAALDHLYKAVADKKFMDAFNKLMKEDKQFYVDRIAAQMLQEGFLHGLWTVDLMITLVEPLIILLVWTASLMDLSVSFSTDNGSEDRTGFEDVFGGLVGFEEAAQETQDIADGQDVSQAGMEPPVPDAQPAAQTQPTAPAMQSPLVGGM